MRNDRNEDTRIRTAIECEKSIHKHRNVPFPSTPIFNFTKHMFVFQPVSSPQIILAQKRNRAELMEYVQMSLLGGLADGPCERNRLAEEKIKQAQNIRSGYGEG